MKKLIDRNSRAFKDLAVILSGSVLVYLAMVLSGAFDALEQWGSRNRLDRVHLDELLMILFIGVLAGAVFFVRRSAELKEEVSERKEAQNILRESRNRIRAQHNELDRMFKKVEIVKNEWERTLDCLGDMVILVDDRGGISRCNRAFKDFVGRTYGDILGKNVETLMAESGVEAKEFDGHRQDVYCASKNKWFEIYSYPFQDQMTGDISGAAVIIHDFTGRKRALDMLKNGESSLV